MSKKTTPSNAASTPAQRPMANALSGLRQQLREDTPTSSSKPAPSRYTGPARPLSHAARPHPLATIEQPHNAPVPTSLAHALGPLSTQVRTRSAQAASRRTNTPAATRTPAPASFAELMREQDRRPASAALQEKLNWGLQADNVQAVKTSKNSSTKIQEAFNQREDTYTPPPSSHQHTKTSTTHTVAPALQELKNLHKAYQAQQAKLQAEQTRQQAQVRQQHAAKQAFLHAVGAVQALPDTGKLLHHQPREPIAAQRQLDEQAVLREALSDEFDAGTLLDTDEALSFLRPGVSLDIARKLRKGEWTIQKQVDLHGLRTDEARESLGSFIRECHRAGLRCVRVIHGKGLGSPGKAPVLKSRVHRWLVQKAEVMAFVQASPNQGGHGAVVVLLRPPAR